MFAKILNIQLLQINMRILIGFIFFFTTFQAFGQGDYKSDFWYGGLSFNKYIYGLTPFDIYAYDVNHLESNTNKYCRKKYRDKFCERENRIFV
jgi:hypothetical protein